MRYIPCSQYTNIYHSLFLSHLTYAISTWGGVAKYKRDKIFSIQKRCIRLLFGSELSYDHSEYYETCARVRTYDEHCKPKNYVLEHTKPLFTEHDFLTVHNLYFKYIFVETFKVLKYRLPFGLYSEYIFSPNIYKMGVTLSCPNVKLQVSKHNFLYKSCTLWNSFADNVLETNELNKDWGYIIPGEKQNSDLSASMYVIKKNINLLLLKLQAKGSKETWDDENFTIFSYTK